MLSPHRYLLGTRAYLDDENQMGIETLSRNNIVYDKMCKLLASHYDFANSENKIVARRLLGIDSLKRVSRSEPIIALTPSEYFGMKYEEIRVRFFWSAALGDWLMDTANINNLMKDTEEKFDSKFSNKEGFSQDGFSMSLQTLSQTLYPKDFLTKPVSGSTVLDEKLKAFFEDWETFVAQSSVTIGDHVNPFIVEDKYNSALRRLRFDDLTVDSIWRAGTADNEFDFGVNCAAVRFAVSRNYILAQSSTKYDTCEWYKKYHQTEATRTMHSW